MVDMSTGTGQEPADGSTPSPGMLAKRRRIYDAAMRLFRERGFETTTAEEIATAAGVSRASFFNHFGSKAAVLHFYGENLDADIASSLDGKRHGRTPLRELERVLLSMARKAEDQRENLRIAMAHMLREKDYLSKPSPARRRVFMRIAGLIEEAQGLGEVRNDIGAVALAEQVMSLYNGLILSILHRPANDGKLLADFWAFAHGGLVGRPSNRKGRRP